jgi:hypothetical protein
MKPEGFPDLFVVGAPRCGTTALCNWLEKHPRICFSQPKEPHYFTHLATASSDLRRDYLRRFFYHYQPDRHAVVGEGSVSYLYSKDAIEQVLALNPDARLVVHVRNPIELVRSYHARMCYTLEEDETDFAKAWNLQSARARGERIPRLCRRAELLQYAEIGQLGKHLAQLFDVAGEERCLVNVYDDFRRDPRTSYERVLAFAGVASDGRTRFPAKQTSRTYRHGWLQRVLMRPAMPVARVVEVAERSRPGRKRLMKRIRKGALRWNTVESQPAPLSAELIATLRDAFRDDVALLSDVLERDLRGWLA